MEVDRERVGEDPPISSSEAWKIRLESGRFNSPWASMPTLEGIENAIGSSIPGMGRGIFPRLYPQVTSQWLRWIWHPYERLPVVVCQRYETL